MTTQSILSNQTENELITIKTHSQVHGQIWTIYSAQENCSNLTNFCSNVCYSFLILLSIFCTTMIKSMIDLLFSLTCILVKFKTENLHLSHV